MPDKSTTATQYLLVMTVTRCIATICAIVALSGCAATAVVVGVPAAVGMISGASMQAEIGDRSVQSSYPDLGGISYSAFPFNWKSVSQPNQAAKHLDDLIPIMESQWRTAKELGMSEYSTLYNAMTFLLLLHYDFAVLAHAHAAEVDVRKQNLYARQLCLLMHEALDDIPHVFGVQFRKATASLPSGEAHLTVVSSALKSLGVIRKEHESAIAEIRNYVGAHRDHNALTQLEIMDRIDSKWLMGISTQFTGFLGEMAKSLTPLLGDMGNAAVILSHLGRSK